MQIVGQGLPHCLHERAHHSKAGEQWTFDQKKQTVNQKEKGTQN